MIVPAARERAALTQESLDQCAHARVVQMAAVVDPEFGKHAMGAILEVANQRAGGGRQEDVSEQVALMVPVEPADEEFCAARFHAMAFQ